MIQPTAVCLPHRTISISTLTQHWLFRFRLGHSSLAGSPLPLVVEREAIEPDGCAIERLRYLVLAAAAMLSVLSVPGAKASTLTAVDLYALGSNFVFPGGATLAPVAGGQVAGSVGSAAAVASPSGVVVLGGVSSLTNGTNGQQQVGQVFTQGANHAYQWNGTANSAVDLHPSLNPIYQSSEAFGTNGSQQVGSALTIANTNHAMLWNGSAISFVDLDPIQLGVGSSFAFATDGSQQVGQDNFSGSTHAILWNGTAASAVDLSPIGLSGFDSSSFANGVGGGQQVGYGMFLGKSHAVLWSGTAGSAVDLQPTSLGFDQSDALGTNGSQQVGWLTNTGDNPFHAVIWNGTANSALDLHALLPAGYSSSIAFSIDASGDVFGTAVDSSGITHAIEWTIVPEPSTWAIGVIGLTALAFAARRRRPQSTSYDRSPR